MLLIRITDDEVFGFDAAIRGMRNPLNSWNKSDSCGLAVGDRDRELMRMLISAGPDHSKFMRYINVTCDVEAPQFWWMEFDTYKIGTVRNSCSKMHRIHVKEFTYDDFTHEGLDQVGGLVKAVFERYLIMLEDIRLQYNETKNRDLWRALIEMLPTGYNMRATIQLNYQVLRNIYHSRRDHKLTEWHEFCAWIETLPCSELITQ